MASPHVAGVGALYLEANATAPPSYIKKLMLDAAVNGSITDVGEGSPNLLVNTEQLFVTTPASPPQSSARVRFSVVSTVVAVMFALLV
jgi:subtilisin family serine protease